MTPTITIEASLQEALRRYLAESGESMRALSLRAGLNAKAVSDLLSIPGITPRRTTLDALSGATGLDLGAAVGAAPVTYATLIDRCERLGERRGAQRLRWLCRQAGWVPETTVVCRREAVEFLEGHSAAAAGIQPRSYETYKSEALALVRGGAARRRGRSVADLGPRYRAIHEALGESDLPAWRKGIAGAFLTFLDAEGIAPEAVTTEVLGAYYARRLAVGPKAEATCRRHVKAVAGLVTLMAGHPDLARFGFQPVDHPFEASVGKWGVADEVIAPVMAEFDTHITPWVQGERSRTGQSREVFIAALDAQADTPSDRKAKLRARRAARAARPGQGAPTSTAGGDEDFLAAGFLTAKRCWNARTLATRRGYVASLAKAVVASTEGEIVPESLEELCDPEFLEAAVDAMRDANQGPFPSGHLRSVLKAVLKIARDHQGRPDEDLARIERLIEAQHRPARGIAPRNRARLRRFDAARIQGTIDLGDTIVDGINAEIDRRRRAARRRTGRLPARADVIDAGLARDVMAAIAHEILLNRAPRSDNVIMARLDWIAWQGDEARLVIPAAEVKMGGPDKADLVVPLGARTSRLLRLLLDVVRPKALAKGDEANPYLFPQQGGETHAGQPYRTVLKRVCRLLERHVGVKVNPHLYRHLIGWIWLKDGPEHLPLVQRLLGHEQLQTTLDYYAELDEELVLTRWSDELEARRTGRSRPLPRAQGPRRPDKGTRTAADRNAQ